MHVKLLEKQEHPSLKKIWQSRVSNATFYASWNWVPKSNIFPSVLQTNRPPPTARPRPRPLPLRFSKSRRDAKIAGVRFLSVATTTGPPQTNSTPQRSLQGITLAPHSIVSSPSREIPCQTLPNPMQANQSSLPQQVIGIVLERQSKTGPIQSILVSTMALTLETVPLISKSLNCLT